MQDPSKVRMSGPLAKYAPGFRAWLQAKGYAEGSTCEQLRLMAYVSRWLRAQGLGPEAFGPRRAVEVMATRRRTGPKALRSVRALRPLLAYLGTVGLSPAPEAKSPLEELLGHYRRYLVDERSLAPLTVQGYVWAAGRFLAEQCGGDPGRVPTLVAGDVSGYILGLARGRTARTVNEKVVRLRSFLRFLYLKGLISSPLGQAALWMATSAAGSLPRALAPGAAHRLLASCDRTSVVGSRDFAILTVLARLGLRAGEVAALELDDINWRAGELVVRGKAGCTERLPLPADVGEALASYLCRRAPGGSRSVFLHVVAPRQRIAQTDVRAVVRRACKRAGMADTGVHRFRHSAASEMLRKGAPLYEVGQLLRHRDQKTTAIYAKVDFAALSPLAQPWPGGEP